MEKLSEEIRKQISEAQKEVVKLTSNGPMLMIDGVRVYGICLDVLSNYGMMLEKDELNYWLDVRKSMMDTFVANESVIFETFNETKQYLEKTRLKITSYCAELKKLETATGEEAEKKRQQIKDSISFYKSLVPLSIFMLYPTIGIYCDFYGSDPKSKGYQVWTDIFNTAALVSGDLRRGYSKKDLFRMHYNELKFVADNLVKRIADEPNRYVESTLCVFLQQIEDELKARAAVLDKSAR